MKAIDIGFITLGLAVLLVISLPIFAPQESEQQSVIDIIYVGPASEIDDAQMQLNTFTFSMTPADGYVEQLLSERTGTAFVLVTDRFSSLVVRGQPVEIVPSSGSIRLMVGPIPCNQP